MRRRNLKAIVAGLIITTLLSGASTALADERTEAKAHFKTGMQKISDGDYKTGIEELQRAYQILPHANVLFNIARA